MPIAGDKKYRQELMTKIDGIADKVGTLDKKLDLHIQSTAYELQAIHRLDEQQNKLIDQHIEGVKTLKGMIDRNENNNEARFQVLEAPRKIRSTLAKSFIKAGAVAAAFASVYAAIPYVKQAIEWITLNIDYFN